jgi:hypothetical protein
MTYTVAGVTVVRKYEAQSALPDLVGNALAMMAKTQLSLMACYPGMHTYLEDNCLCYILRLQHLPHLQAER